MSDHINDLIQRYKNKGAVLDSNLLLLLFVGNLDKELVPIFKRTSRYSIEDFCCLRSVISQFKKVCTTPNILTEVVNLGKFDGKYKRQFAQLMAANIGSMEEHYIESKNIASFEEFHRFGLTDAVNLAVAAKGFLFITDDLPLASHCYRMGAAVLTMNHLRQLYMGIQ